MKLEPEHKPNFKAEFELIEFPVNRWVIFIYFSRFE